MRSFESTQEVLDAIRSNLLLISKQPSGILPEKLSYGLSHAPHFQVHIDFECLTTYLGNPSLHFLPYGVCLSFSRQVPRTFVDTLLHLFLDHHFMIISSKVLT